MRLLLLLLATAVLPLVLSQESSLAALGPSAVVLEGSSSSYAQLRRWQAGPQAALSLDFQTQEPSGLLLYADDGGTRRLRRTQARRGNTQARR
ncbi:hypothetical protein MRX96_025171 [Rhipicephalus microplus]